MFLFCKCFGDISHSELLYMKLSTGVTMC